MVQAIYGAILGDIVGSIYEFDNIKTKDYPFLQKRCFFTDDTVATLALADVLADAVQDGSFDSKTDADWRRAFTDNLRSFGRKHPYAGWGSHFNDWLWKDDYGGYKSCGNGSAMRVSAAAWFARSIEECERLARLTAEVSHDHPDGVAGAQATAGAVYLALHDGTKEQIAAYVDRFYGAEKKEYVKKHGLAAFTLDEVRPGYRFDHYAGLCKGTVPFAVEAFLESTDFEDCIRCTVSIGGDTDSLGAVSGAIAEAYYGTPHAFVPAALDKLTPDLRAVLEKLDSLDWPSANAAETEGASC